MSLKLALESSCVISEKEQMLKDLQFKTNFGKTLLTLRQSFIQNGGRLLSADELDQELRSRCQD